MPPSSDGSCSGQVRDPVRLRGKKPELSPRQESHLVALHHTGTHTSAELAELFSVARSTVYRAIERSRTAAPAES